MDESKVLDLGPEAADEGELRLGAAVGLGLVKGVLGDFLGEDGGGLGGLEDTVLAEGEERFEDVLANGEAKDELLPREERAVEDLRKALLGQQSVIGQAGSSHDRGAAMGERPVRRARARQCSD